MVKSFRPIGAMRKMTKDLISIGGYDPSAGAGVLLDIGIFERLGYRGFGVLTAVTAQNPERVDRVFPLAARAIMGQFDRLSEMAVVAGIKVGMIGTSGNLAAVGLILAREARIPRVIDPVFRSSSGALLLEKKAWPRYLDVLGGKADLITPNLDEAEILVGGPVRSVQAMRKAAAEITRATGIPCLIKGGHLAGRPVDVLYDGRAFTDFEQERVARDVHGTGCFLSSAILGRLAEGRTLKEACGLGIALVGKAIRKAVPAAGGRWTFDLSRGPNRGGSRGPW
jgi:hydroxymethylpyrimidine/phosphomethylpyrimidine kinase